MRSRDRFHHPSTEADLCALVRRARREGLKLRVRGAAHSVPGAIYADDLNVMLDRYTAVSFDDAHRRVTVQAGCHLGLDPRDPTRTSTWENSLLAQLDARGWALPDLGGVSHQTVAGFLSTGSCGGSVQHAIEDAVVALRIIDGTGVVRELHRDRDPLFFAALCSMGLFGVISTVTFQCVPAFDIVGREDITEEHACGYELYGDGDAGLEGFLRRAEYARLMWWPQAGVRRVVTWQARRMTDADYSAQTGPRGALRPKRYLALGDTFENARLANIANQASQAVGGLFYDGLAQAARVSSLAGTSRFGVRSSVRGAFSAHVLPPVLRAFVPAGSTQQFWDSSHQGLPMDNQMSELSLPTDFTEIWLPLERAGEVMRALRAHYDRVGYDATGPNICEIYAARATRSWMHPGYERDSLRIDLFWFKRNPGDPRSGWFMQFWKLLRPFAYRLHWGKQLPRSRALGADHLRTHTPRWDEFLAARQAFDPDNVFFTRYWREALGLDAV